MNIGVPIEICFRGIGERKMKITDGVLTRNGPVAELSAEIGGHRLWYRVPSEYNVTTRGDPFLVAGFFPAMAVGETLDVEQNVTISPKLKNGIAELQAIFYCCSPLLKKLKAVGKESTCESGNPGVASFSSGGIDGL